MEDTVLKQREPSLKKTVLGHVLNWALMIAMTIVAFIAVGMRLLPPPALIALILFFAVIQVFLQVIFFMHMKDERIWPGLFMAWGGMLGAIFALGVWWMV